MSTGIASKLAKAQGIKFVALTHVFAPTGERRIPSSAKSLFLPKGYCYGAFTGYPAGFDIPIIAQCRSTLIVRDPRDLLVSLYYSVKLSHPEPSEQSAQATRELFLMGRDFANSIDIDNFVLKSIPWIHALYSSYASILDLQTLKVFRYEDVIYRKRAWVEEICDHYRWKVGKAVRNAIADSYDEFPEQEQRTKHVRQVHPGNYKNQLQDKTIRSIEAAFAEQLKFYGYHSQAASDLDAAATKAAGLSAPCAPAN
jgi:hypothetical protein